MGGSRSYDAVNFGGGGTGFAGLTFPLRGQARNPDLRRRLVLMPEAPTSIWLTTLLVFSRHLMQSAPDDVAWISTGYFAAARRPGSRARAPSVAPGRVPAERPWREP